MNPMEGMAQQMTRFGRNTAYNLGFISEDDLNWKPAPTAKSALEIASHVLGVVHAWISVLEGGDYAPPQPVTVTSLTDAQERLRRAAEEYAGRLRRLSPADLERTVQLPFGSFPLAQAVRFPLVDMVHHHGQIAYLQTMRGDTENHFERI